jgi:hypothetical protein
MLSAQTMNQIRQFHPQRLTLRGLLKRGFLRISDALFGAFMKTSKTNQIERKRVPTSFVPQETIQK